MKGTSWMIDSELKCTYRLDQLVHLEFVTESRLHADVWLLFAELAAAFLDEEVQSRLAQVILPELGCLWILRVVR